MIECNAVEGKSIINSRVVFSLLLLLLMFLVLAMPRVVWSEEINFEPPGQLIDVNGRNMHINCIGNKSPSIILDSGAGGFSLEWRNIQKSLSQYARVCAYDRAGYGWSDMGLLPRTTKRITHELHTLLQNAGIHGPYILVGHSFGGFTAQYFARNFGDEIAGIVLIDSSHEEQVYRLPENGKDVVRRSLHQDRSNMVTKSVIHEHYPEEEAAVAQQLMTRWSALLTWREEMANYALSSRELRDVYYKPILEIPIVVLSRGKRVWPDTPYGDAMEATWKELQDELSYLNGNSTHIIAENSGHLIHLDEPELVVDAIHDVLDFVEKELEEQGG
ncbi:MAG: alpha/beta hydrolase [Gammaproteobacteria bacterium]|nr:alpha/beta hydrolase [Gammaproteobacteria bacterium]